MQDAIKNIVTWKGLQLDDPCHVCGKKMKFHKLTSVRENCMALVELELQTRPEGREQKY